MKLSELALIISQVNDVDTDSATAIDAAITETEQKLRALRTVRRALVEQAPAEEKPKTRARAKKETVAT